MLNQKMNIKYDPEYIKKIKLPNLAGQEDSQGKSRSLLADH